MEMAKLLKLIKPIALIVLVLALGGYIFRSCNLTDENSKLKGIIEVKDSLLKQQEERTALAKTAYEKALADQGAEALHWKEIADKSMAGVTTGATQIKDLKERLAKLNPAEKDAIIQSQKEIINAQEENITLLYRSVEAKDKIIYAWEVKFEKWELYRVELETENAELHSLVGAQKDLISRLEKDLRWARGQSKVKNVLLAAAGGYVLYTVVKK